MRSEKCVIVKSLTQTKRAMKLLDDSILGGPHCACSPELIEMLSCGWTVLERDREAAHEQPVFKALPSSAVSLLGGVSLVTLSLSQWKASWALASLFLGQPHRIIFVSNTLTLSIESGQ